MDTRRILLLLLVCLISIAGNSQNPDSLLFKNFKETVWLSSDKQLYLPGETIDIKAVLFEQDTYTKSQFSKYLKIELHNSDGQALNQSVLKLNNSEISESLILPADANTGWYYIRGYTNWMRNFGDEGYSILAIKVIDPQDEQISSYLGPPTQVKAKLYLSSGKTGLYIGYDDFQGIAASGHILSFNNDTLAAFSCHGSGWTTIQTSILERTGLRIVLDNLNIGAIVPEVISADDNKELLKFNQDDNFIYIDYPTDKTNTQITVHQSYKTIWSAGILSNQNQWRISKNGLPGGIIQFTLTDSNKTILSQALWSKSEFLLSELTLTNGKDFSYRQQNEILVDFASVESAELTALITLSEPTDNLLSYAPGLPGWVCDYSVPNEALAFDAWLTSQSINLTKRQKFWNPDIIHLPEIEAGIIEGRVINRNTKEGLNDINISINILNDNSFEESKTDSTGYFYFVLPGHSGPTDYLLSLTNGSSEDILIEAYSPFEESIKNLNQRFSITDDELSYLRSQNIRIQLEEVYKEEKELDQKAQDTATEKITFFHPPDFTIVVDNYIKLANIREVIYEVVPNVVVRKKDGLDYLKVYSDQSFSESFETLVLLDGIPLRDQGVVLGLSPDRIEKVEVKNKVYIHGRSIYSSIVNFISPNRDYAGIELPESSILSTFKLPAPGIAKLITTGTTPESMARMSETIEWTDLEYPKTNKLRFQTNDLSGSFRIKVYGFDHKGNWILGTKDITVLGQK